MKVYKNCQCCGMPKKMDEKTRNEWHSCMGNDTRDTKVREMEKLVY